MGVFSMDNLNHDMGKRIAELRKEHHLTQADLAEALDISIKHCSSVERGLSRLSIEKLIEVTNLFHTSLDYLIQGKCSSNQYLELFPSTLLDKLDNGDEEQLKLFERYLEIYDDLLNSRPVDCCPK